MNIEQGSLFIGLIRVPDLRKVFAAVKDGLFVPELQVYRQDKMDVLFAAGVNTAAGNMKREKLIGGKAELFQEDQLQGVFRVIQGNGKVCQSERGVSSSCHLNDAGSEKAFSG